MMILRLQSFLRFDSFNTSRMPESSSSFRRSPAFTKSAFNRNIVDNKNDKKKASVCTADELHYVQVEKSEWRVALWRYLPSPQPTSRNHPLVLLSGVGTNAIGYDLSPESSFARFMSSQGYDTWIIELRGAGLSAQEVDFGHSKDPLDSLSQGKDLYVKDGKYGANAYTDGGGFSIKRGLSSFSETPKRYDLAGRIRDFMEKLVHIIQEAERASPARFLDMQVGISTTLKDIQKQLDLMGKYDWDFDHYLEEDVPAAMEYVKDKCKPKDGKLLAIGHSMGGILLYAMLSRCEPVQVLNVPVIPIGPLIAAAHPFATNPPYILSWLSPQISATDMMQPELFEKLAMENFETVPAKLLLQLATAFHEGGLRDRSGTFFYKDHLSKSKVPVLAIAGDQDLICPPDAVYETAKLIPEPLITYKVFGEPGGPHYAHYDLVGGRWAADQIYPCIIEFLDRHDAEERS